MSLPIAAHKAELLEAIAHNRVIVVVGDTGCGKTTQLPQYLLDCHRFDENKCIAVTQPRRVAAVSVATRVAEERKSQLGDDVGYAIRWETKCSESTKLKYMTDGVLLREFMTDRTLSRYSVVILDEAHERSMQTDMLFGLMKQYITSQDDRPRLVIMSATLDHEKVAAFFGCHVFHISGRVYPVQTYYHGLIELMDYEANDYVSRAVDLALEIHTEKPAGDILIFLTGAAEIERACDMLFKKSEQLDYNHDVMDEKVDTLMILPLYGALSSEQQRRVFAVPTPAIRRIVVSTNIAATSITVDGIVYVIDSGLVKQKTYHPKTGLEALEIVPISRSEGDQRKGRAGRTRPGECHRLYSETCFSSMRMDTIPEIQRTSLTSVALCLKCSGIVDVLSFQYIDPPDETLMIDALKQLCFFEALSPDGELTELGKRMSEFPLPPSMSRALIRACSLGCAREACMLVSLLSVENVSLSGTERGRLDRRDREGTQSGKRTRPGFRKDDSAVIVHGQTQFNNVVADCIDDYAALLHARNLWDFHHQSKDWCRQHGYHLRALQSAERVALQLRDELLKQGERISCISTDAQLGKRGQIEPLPLNENQLDLLREAMCFGHFHMIARRAVGSRYFRTMDGHGTAVFVHPGSQLCGHEDLLDWVVFHEAVMSTKVFMRYVAPVKYVWISALLPRLHNVDLQRLIGRKIIPAATGWALTQVSNSNELTQAVSIVPERRNDDRAVESARERYLKRKKLL